MSHSDLQPSCEGFVLGRMKSFENLYRVSGQSIALGPDVPFPSEDIAAATTLISGCPIAAETPLVSSPDFARLCGVQSVTIKDERGRMGLGSFKALGAAYVIAQDHASGADMSQRTYVTASAGNHGMSVAAGAQAFGAKSVVYIAQSVPESFAGRLRETGAEVRREGAVYEDSMAAAAKAADDHGWLLLSDSSWPGYFEMPHRLMEGYLILMGEVFRQIDHVPTHIFLQAGVGGLATSAAAMARREWGAAPRIIVIEPQVAEALMASIKAGKAVTAPGPVSSMGRLDCKEPSLIALAGLARDADLFVSLSEEEAAQGVAALAAVGLESSASGAAGLAALLTGDDALGLTKDAKVLCILSEGPAN